MAGCRPGLKNLRFGVAIWRHRTEKKKKDTHHDGNFSEDVLLGSPPHVREARPLHRHVKLFFWSSLRAKCFNRADSGCFGCGKHRRTEEGKNINRERQLWGGGEGERKEREGEQLVVCQERGTETLVAQCMPSKEAKTLSRLTCIRHSSQRLMPPPKTGLIQRRRLLLVFNVSDILRHL